MTTRDEAIAKVVGGTPETKAKFVDQLIELGEFMPGVHADADILLPLADRIEARSNFRMGEATLVDMPLVSETERKFIVTALRHLAGGVNVMKPKCEWVVPADTAYGEYEVCRVCMRWRKPETEDEPCSLRSPFSRAPADLAAEIRDILGGYGGVNSDYENRQKANKAFVLAETLVGVMTETKDNG